MAENEKNFWDRNEDDFWNKPVMDDNWLKQEKNPYVREQETEPQTTGYQSNDYYSDGYQSTGYRSTGYQSTGYRTESAQQAKVRHAHTIVCLIFMAAAAASVIVAVVLTAVLKSAARKEVRLAEYEETAEADTLGYIACYDNGTVYLEDTAYTVYDAGTYPTNPENKLIAIYVEAVSDRYVSGQYSMEQCYVGFDTPYGRQYCGEANTDKLIPYIVRHGYAPDDMITGLGIANGNDTEGYYFFYVPQEVTKLTLYCEQREKIKGASVLKMVYTKSYRVLSAEE